MIRRFTVIAIASVLAAGLAACEDEPRSEPVDVDAMAAEDAAAETTVEAPAPAPAVPGAVDAAQPADPGALPADKRPSEETVQPESETLFY